MKQQYKNNNDQNVSQTSFLPMMLTVLFVLLSFILCQPSFADNNDKEFVKQIRLWHSPDQTRIVFDMSADVKHSVFTLMDPLRLVVDIENADFRADLPKVDATNKHIITVRSGRPSKQLLRFVFELKRPLITSDFILSPNELYGHRLVIDLDVEMPKTSVQSSIPLQTTLEENTENEVNNSKLQPVLQSFDRVQDGMFTIAIDAGHGGEDPGAIGYRKRSKEKNITLEIAKRLKKVIDSNAKLTSFLVRKGDYFIKLNKRQKIARQHNADIFISIHADAFSKGSASGFSVFALSQRGATSAMARTLAAKENASDLIGGVSLKDKDEVLAKVLVDLSMTNTISESVNFGGRVIKELNKVGKLHSSKVEQAGFAVLKSPDIPSVLIETGFITNPAEEKNLRSSSYQQKIANSIYQAIIAYYQKTPFYNNAIYASRSVSLAQSSSVKKPAYHRVKRGDSLSEIALKYGMSLKQLKELNGLRNNTAVLGQRLKVSNSSSSLTSSSFTQKKSGKALKYKVRNGDSLSRISAKYNVTIKSIKMANNLRSNNLIIGKTLLIPGVYSAPKASYQTHTVKRGDTLSEIAQRYKSSMKTIIALNKLRNKTVMLGQKLKIPQ